MKYKLLIFFALFSCLTISAKSLKINYKAEIKPFFIKIEKAEFQDDQTLVNIKIKQQKNFSYNISLSDCYIIVDNDTIKGTVAIWNDIKKPTSDNKPVSDEKEEKLTISFPGNIFSETSSFDLKLGNILDRKKTDLFFTDIPVSKR